MILPDVNVLVYAFDEDSPHHDPYKRWLTDALGAAEDLAFLESVLSGFVRIVTHPRIMPRPAPADVALAFTQALVGAPPARWIRSGAETWAAFTSLCAHDPGIRGNLVPNAVLAAAASAHGARVATADRGFARFGVRFFDPADPGR